MLFPSSVDKGNHDLELLCVFYILPTLHESLTNISVVLYIFNFI